MPLVPLPLGLDSLTQNGNIEYHLPLVYLLNQSVSGSGFGLSFAPCLAALCAGDLGDTPAGQNSTNNNICAVLAQEQGGLFSDFPAHMSW